MFNVAIKVIETQCLCFIWAGVSYRVNSSLLNSITSKGGVHVHVHPLAYGPDHCLITNCDRVGQYYCPFLFSGYFFRWMPLIFKVLAYTPSGKLFEYVKKVALDLIRIRREEWIQTRFNKNILRSYTKLIVTDFKLAGLAATNFHIT